MGKNFHNFIVAVDKTIIRFMQRTGHRVERYILATLFGWFGSLEWEVTNPKW